ncbi:MULTISPECIES: glutamyl-tRNA reductase [Haloarcula]|uniref:glutamyl-tRNA reductase n=1 Tax=Haloarcula TaxID=2237 RepID=UPI0023EC0DD8|nr:glutamyl-tRNA reductase [Halomicroarcula sp. XH51]
MEGMTGTDETPDVEQAVEHMCDRGATVRSAQVERALEELRADGDLTDAQRQAVERLSDRLVERLLAVPRESLRAADRAGDVETVETAMELFG